MIFVLRYLCDFSSWWNTFCVSGFIICLSCVIVKYSGICAKQTTEGAAGSHLLRSSSGKTWARCYQGCGPQRTWGVSLWQLPGFAKHSCHSGMFLIKLFQAVVPAWGSSKCWAPKTFNGVRLMLAFGTAGFSDHEAAQALSLTWLLSFLFQIPLLIFDYYIIFSRTL